jgi:Domain of unknown function (DUF1844)
MLGGVAMAEREDEGFKVTDRRRRENEPPEPPRSAAPGGERASPDAPSLRGLFMMLATEAVIALGDAPDPTTGERRRELPHASQMIDLLVLLREKTAGNRTEDETKTIEDLLYDLQLRFVRATKSPE